MEDSPKRPVAITILCIVAGVSVLAALIHRLIQCVSHGTPWLYIQVLEAATVLLCILGFWQMRRWSIPLYALAVTANMAAGLSHGSTMSWPYIVVPLAILCVLLFYHKAMQ